MSYCARRPPGKYETNPTDRSAPAGFTHALQPQQPERQTVLDSVRGFIIGNSKDGPIGGTSAQQTADVTARKRMFQIRCSSEGFHGFVGELLREQTTKPRAKRLA